MSGFTPLTRAQFRSILVTQFQNSLTSAGILLADVPDTSSGTVMGASFDALSLMAVQQQYQNTLIQTTARLSTIPANPDGSPNPDVDSFVAPFGYTRLAGGFASSTTFSLNLNSVSGSPIIIPTGLIFQRGDGVPFVLVDDTSQPAYNGSHGYTIPAGQTSRLATATCLQAGTVGNTPANTSWTVYSGPGVPIAPGLGSITNASAITNGTGAESDAALKSRFTLGMQNGKWAVITAIQAAVAGSQIGLTYSYGDHVNQDGSYHAAYFTIVVNIAGSPTTPSGTLITTVSNAVNLVRAGGIEYQVVAPNLVTPTMAGNIAVRAGYSSSAVLAAVQTAVQAYVNNIGLDPNGGTTTLSYAQALADMIAVAGVNPVGTTLSINSGTSDVTAPFGSQIVLPTVPAFTTS